MWRRTHWLSFFWLAPSSFSLVKITFPPLSSGEEMIMGSICVCKVRVWAQVQRKLARRKCRHIAAHSTWQQHELRTSKDAVAQWLFCTSTNGTISFFAGLTFTKANIHLLSSVMPWKNQQKCKGQRFLLFLWDLARFFPFFFPIVKCSHHRARSLHASRCDRRRSCYSHTAFIFPAECQLDEQQGQQVELVLVQYVQRSRRDAASHDANARARLQHSW